MCRPIKKQWANLVVSVNEAKATLETGSISQSLVDLLILAEDHRYGTHPGVDLVALCRAAWRTYFCGRKEGGSTIAMQLVRVLTNRYERTLRRKVVEIILAVKLSKYLSKADMPKLYLALAYYGWRMNGLNQACVRLDLNKTDMSLNDAAMLVARLKYPEPKMCGEKRRNQISRRAKHILLRRNEFDVDSTSRLYQGA